MRPEILLIAHLTSLWMVSSFIKFYLSNQVRCVRVSQYHCATGDETEKKRHLLKIAKGYRYTFSLSDGRGTIHA